VELVYSEEARSQNPEFRNQKKEIKVIATIRSVAIPYPYTLNAILYTKEGVLFCQ